MRTLKMTIAALGLGLIGCSAPMTVELAGETEPGDLMAQISGVASHAALVSFRGASMQVEVKAPPGGRAALRQDGGEVLAVRWGVDGDTYGVRVEVEQGHAIVSALPPHHGPGAPDPSVEPREERRFENLARDGFGQTRSRRLVLVLDAEGDFVATLLEWTYLLSTVSGPVTIDEWRHDGG